MLSRKQQWRKMCGSSRRRRSGGGGGDGHDDRHGHTPASCTQGNHGNSSSGAFEEQLLPPCAPSTLATAVGAKQRALQPGSARSLAGDSLCSSTTSFSSSTSSINNSSRGDEDDGRTTRSVSFEQRTRVILVPTRHELKERVCEHEHEEDGQPQPGTGGGGGGKGGGGGGGGDDDNGIWWTMQECYGFRMAYRRQIYALGLKACRTLLCPASTVFLAGAAEEAAEEQEEEEQEQEARRDSDLSIAAAATVTAAAAATAAAAGGCYVPAAGEVLSSPPSPCLQQEVVVG